MLGIGLQFWILDLAQGAVQKRGHTAALIQKEPLIALWQGQLEGLNESGPRLCKLICQKQGLSFQKKDFQKCMQASPGPDLLFPVNTRQKRFPGMLLRKVLTYQKQGFFFLIHIRESLFVFLHEGTERLLPGTKPLLHCG